MQKQCAQAAEFELRAEYILNAIAKQEQIEVTDADILPQLEYYASALRRSVDWVRKNFEHEGNLDALYNVAREGKALECVVKNAQVTER